MNDGMAFAVLLGVVIGGTIWFFIIRAIVKKVRKSKKKGAQRAQTQYSAPQNTTSFNTSQSVMTSCPNCKNTDIDGDVFCPNCGYRLR